MTTTQTTPKQAIIQRRDLLNIVTELERDSARLLRRAEILRRVVNQMELDNNIGKGANKSDVAIPEKVL
jgi:hypothetical protein